MFPPIYLYINRIEQGTAGFPTEREAIHSVGHEYYPASYRHYNSTWKPPSFVNEAADNYNKNFDNFIKAK
ncbi:hypothetical protein AYI70_g9810 [Smittium culicis]|uniref:Uncharacterized protein n=1 Tax=Smittium culicis TaxID=133412 RepID=A0A1R1X9K0_9FUNG|nr:hypothetical protein AYI70_g9810 [Smittium culicis]